jgi:hypothetical protein
MLFDIYCFFVEIATEGIKMGLLFPEMGKRSIIILTVN